MSFRRPLAIVICALVLSWVPEALAQSSTRSVSRSGRSNGYAPTYRRSPGTDYEKESLERKNRRLEEQLGKERSRRWKDEEDEEEETRGPSGGPACMYAADGTLVFAPRGKDCSGAASAAAPTPRPKPRAAKSSTRKPSGSCMRGADGSVIYAPAGVDCGK